MPAVRQNVRRRVGLRVSCGFSSRNAHFKALCATFIVASACRAAPPHEERLLVMGTEARIVVHGYDEGTMALAAGAARRELIACEEALSDYLATSELRAVTSRWAAWTEVSERLACALRAGVRVADGSGGAYDPTLLPVVALWRAARQSGAAPSDESLAAARENIGFRAIELRTGEQVSVRCTRTGVALDLGGVGKGLAAHRAAAAARSAGATACLVSLSGDIRAEGCPPGSDGWRIAVADGLGGGGDVTLVLQDLSVSTSGDTEQWAVIDGRRVGHLIDPRTARPLLTCRASTAVGPDGAIVDAAATAACVAGPGEAASLVRALDLRALRVREAGSPHAPASSTAGAWQALLEDQRAP